MRKFILVLIASTVTFSGIKLADACGDKTMRVKSGLRYRQIASKHPSSILIHTAALPAGKAAQLRDFLKDIGHKATAFDDVNRLSDDLKTGQYDLVLTALAEAPNLQKQVESFTPKTMVVPVMFKRTKVEEAAAARQYKVIVKNPTGGEDFLYAIYQVMKSRSKKA